MYYIIHHNLTGTMRAGLPSGMVQQLLSRDIADSDYDLLLQLDQPTIGPTLSVAMLGQLKALTKISTHEICVVCNHKVLTTQQYRVLPCKHVFHTLCIDPWLLHQRNSCPLDGMSATVVPTLPATLPSKAKR